MKYGDYHILRIVGEGWVIFRKIVGGYVRVKNSQGEKAIFGSSLQAQMYIDRRGKTVMSTKHEVKLCEKM